MATQNKIQTSTVLRRSAEVLADEIDGETVMMSIEQGEYYGLDTIASEIWALLEKPRSVAALCEKLVERYDVEPDQCERDVVSFLETLLADGTIRTMELEANLTLKSEPVLARLLSEKSLKNPSN